MPTLGISPVLGRNFLPEEDRPGGPKVALISYGLWMTHYNRDPGVLNKTIDIDGKPVRVIGVLPKEFEMPRLQAADVLFPLAANEATDRKSNSGLGGPKRVFARLKPGVSAEQARAELEPLFEQTQKWIPAEIRSNFKLKVRSLRDRQMQDVRLTAWVLLGTVFAVLLIACANVASLLMARGAARQRELAVRSALGAGRARLVCQALTEALVLSLAGAVAGWVLAQGLLHIFLALAPAGIPYLDRVHIDLRIVVLHGCAFDCLWCVVWSGTGFAEAKRGDVDGTFAGFCLACFCSSVAGGGADCCEYGSADGGDAAVAQLLES